MREAKLPLTGRSIPKDRPIWLHESEFLFRSGENSLKTEQTYRSGLRMFADWIQHFKKAGYSIEDDWPISVAQVDNELLIQHRQWLLANRSAKTTQTYMAGVLALSLIHI